ncbi:MAG: hypothetical protein ACR2P7_06555, partial [bacterium]
AQALSALDALGADLTEPALRPAISRLLQTQCADGHWRETLLWRGPVPPAPPSLGYASAALNTAFCVEALHRFAQRAGLRASPVVAAAPTRDEHDSFAALLHPLRTLFPPHLLAECGWTRVLDAAERLPYSTGAQAFGFEFRLAEARAAADLCVAVEPNSQLAWHLIARGERESSCESSRRSPDALLGEYLRAQCELRDSFAAQSVASTLLEYDVAEVSAQHEPRFGIFLLPRAPNRARIEWRNDRDEMRALHRALAAIAGWDDDDDANEEWRALSRVLAALARSDHGHVYHAGVMPQRMPRAIRLVLRGMTPAEIVALLTRLSWRGSLDAVNAALSATDTFAQVALSVDASARDAHCILPRIGLELYQSLPWDACSRAAWHPLLDALQRRGQCLAQKADALREWPGARPLFGRTSAYRTRVGINHIKIALEAERIEAKAYVGMMVREER